MSDLYQEYISSCQFETERKFAVMLTKKTDIRVMLVRDDDTSYTDGTTIVISPQVMSWYNDTVLLTELCAEMGLPKAFAVPAAALRTIIRGCNVHECLHIIYSPMQQLPVYINTVPEKLQRLYKLVMNIFEDSYIEAKGSQVFGKLAFFLKFIRLGSHLSLNDNPKAESDIDKVISWLFDKYLTHIECDFPELSVPGLADELISLADIGTTSDNPNERLRSARQFTLLIEQLLPASEEYNPEPITVFIEKLLSSSRTENNEECDSGEEHFESCEDGTNNSSMLSAAQDFLDEIEEESPLTQKPKMPRDRLADTQNVTITRISARPEGKTRSVDISRKHNAAINRMTQRFKELIFDDERVIESKKSFGTSIDSRRLGDIKGRYWKDYIYDQNPSDLSVVIIVDASGSMHYNNEITTESVAALAISLKRCSIPVTVAFHNDWTSGMLINVAATPDSSEKEAAEAILSAFMCGDSDELAALKWAAETIKNADSDKKLIISVSDGQPSNISQAAEYVRGLRKMGISACAIAVNDSYEDLSEMYPLCSECNSPEDLPKNLIACVKRALMC